MQRVYQFFSKNSVFSKNKEETKALLSNPEKSYRAMVEVELPNDSGAKEESELQNDSDATEEIEVTELSPMEALPTELKDYILSFSSVSDAFKMAQVSKEFNQILLSSPNQYDIKMEDIEDAEIDINEDVEINEENRDLEKDDIEDKSLFTFKEIFDENLKFLREQNRYKEVTKQLKHKKQLAEITANVTLSKSDGHRRNLAASGLTVGLMGGVASCITVGVYTGGNFGAAILGGIGFFCASSIAHGAVEAGVSINQCHKDNKVKKIQEELDKNSPPVFEMSRKKK